MIHESLLSCVGGTPLVRLGRLFPTSQVIAKLEFLNPGGSIKDRPALHIIEQALRSGRIAPGSAVIESSSGNMGIALAIAARCHGLTFICVVDPKIAEANLTILRHLGAQIEMVTERDAQGGYLETRIARVQELLRADPALFWINQYANPLNCEAHFAGTAAEILADIDGPIDYFVAAISTSGTILGVSRRLREAFPGLKVVAVDTVGSILFNRPPGPRHIPGIGASRKPELLNEAEIDEVVAVTDMEAVRGCHDLLAYEGMLAGGSSGAVVAGLRALAPRLPADARVVTLLPDRGERYLESIYNPQWCAELEASLGAADLAYERRTR